MAIRFSCPACQQPLEIDDHWAGQSVACPYCRRVVTAPQATTWPGSNVPMAAPGWPVDPSAQQQQPGFGPPPASGYGPPAAPGFAPPPPPPGYGPQMGYGQPMSYAPTPGASAAWGLTLTIVGALMLIGLTMAWGVLMTKAATDTLGKSATQAEKQKYMEESWMKGEIPHRQGLAVTGAIAMLCSIGGVVLAVRGLVRRESGRGMAIAACILGGIFLFCQIVMEMFFVAARAAT